MPVSNRTSLLSQLQIFTVMKRGKGCLSTKLTSLFLLHFFFTLFTLTHPHSASSGSKNSKKTEKSAGTISRGKSTYLKKCRYCHGATGQGDGPAAKYLVPKPRNFHSGVFKLRSTSSGALPTDEDLFATIRDGIPGTAMPAFGKSPNAITDENIWELIVFLQTLSYLWADDEEFSTSQDPEDREEYRYNQIETSNPTPPFTERVLTEGAQIYKKAKCHECHGNKGRGDGDTAYELKDEWKENILPRNLHKRWRYKGGSSVEKIFKTITTGMNGTPMPSFKKALTEQERWALSFFIESITENPREEKLLKIQHTKEDVPRSPEDPQWKNLPYFNIRLTGQIITLPRWPTYSIDFVRVKAVYNESQIAFLLVWDDRREDPMNRPPGSEGKKINTGPLQGLPGKEGQPKTTDGIALQFFYDSLSSKERPHFLNGNLQKKVHLWHWQAGEINNKSGETNVTEFLASGSKALLTPLPREKQKTQGTPTFNDGQWKLVVSRPLQDGTFYGAPAGTPVSFGIQAWDGSAGEEGLKKSISSWKWLLLLPPRSSQDLVYPFLVFLGTLGLNTLLFFKLRRQPD
ncbi:MAG: c-type cytochrome [Nitrospinota bacterium]